MDRRDRRVPGFRFDRPVLLLILATILLIGPFAGKAFHIDDPLFIWAARHIQSHPADPYGFRVQWGPAEASMAEQTKNPPLTSYFIALAASVLGWSEHALHLAFLIPAIAAVSGTYVLARCLSAQPALATLIGLSTPVFLLSSTTVMSDVMMLALWVWTVFLWMRGTQRDDHPAFALSALLIAVASLTKYFAVSLLILLPVYTLFKRRRIGLWMTYLLIPLGILAWYQLQTRAIYGRGLLSDAGAYATAVRADFDYGLVLKSLIGLSFTGGCLASLLFYAPFLWSKRVLVIQLVGAAAAILAISFLKTVGTFPLADAHGTRWPQVIELGIFITIGVSALMLAVVDVWASRGAADSVLLFCWTFGTFIFAAFVNWTVNGRSILPAAPAVAILLVRQMARRRRVLNKNALLFWPLAPALLVSLLVTWSDYELAESARTAVERIHAIYPTQMRRLWFQGHWGFQYYMQLTGARSMEMDKSDLAAGDIVVVPENNAGKFPLEPDKIVDPVQSVDLSPSCRWLTTMSVYRGAGFYSDVIGPLPFSVGPSVPERYHILRIESGSHLDRLPALDDVDTGEHDRAIAHYTRDLIENRFDALAFVRRGMAYLKRRAYDRAISDFTDALMNFNNPYQVDFYNDRAGAYMMTGQYDKAIADYTRAISIDPRYVTGYRNRGVAYFSKGEYGLAQQDVRSVRRLGGTYP